MVTTRSEIAAFNRDRDAVLLTGDADVVMAFLKHWNPSLPSPPSREVAILTMHKAIIAAKSLPVAYRRASAHWLLRRGYRTLDEGDL